MSFWTFLDRNAEGCFWLAVLVLIFTGSIVGGAVATHKSAPACVCGGAP